MKKIAIAVMSVALAGPVFSAPDWSKVPVAKVPVFYPGQSGLEWVLTKKDHSAANQILEKKRPCIKCHDTDAVEIGDKIAAGKPVGNLRQPLDTAVPKGKAGSIPVSVQAAHDGNSWPIVAAAGPPATKICAACRMPATPPRGMPKPRLWAGMMASPSTSRNRVLALRWPASPVVDGISSNPTPTSRQLSRRANSWT